MEEKIIIEQSHDKLYNDLLEVVKPYLSDFTGYDEKEQSFNIVLAVKELLGQLEQENEKLKESLKIVSGLCKTLENAKIDEHNRWFSRCCEINNECDTYRSALEEIKAELKDDLTCESRECGCDDYGECLECLKETILNIITEAIGE